MPQQWSPAQRWAPEPAGVPGDEIPSWQPRITPSPPRRGRPIVGILIGLLAGLILFGTAGYFVGTQTAETPAGTGGTPATATPGPRSTASLPPYESSQLAINQAKFQGDLAVFAESWLPWVGGCTSNADPRGPKLEGGEQTRMFCEYGNINVYFVLYKSIEDRDRAGIVRKRQNIDAQVLAPGVAAATQKPGTSGKTTGSYTEFAYRAGAGATARTSCGVWWDDADAPVGGYLETLWTEGLGERWEPMRDVWDRFS